MTGILYVQQALAAAGYDPGPADGLWGGRTRAALDAALAAARGGEAANEPPPGLAGVIPADWLPAARMERIIVHWTAGGHQASALDREHYHILIEADGRLVRGDPSIALNAQPVRPGYAAHTLNCNGGSIGVSLCGMAGAREAPFEAGPNPITAAQWEMLAHVLAQLCARYGIDVTPKTVLTHAEVQERLGIAQRGKWDIAALPFDPGFPRTARDVGARMRAEAARL